MGIFEFIFGIIWFLFKLLFSFIGFIVIAIMTIILLFTAPVAVPFLIIVLTVILISSIFKGRSRH